MARKRITKKEQAAKIDALMEIRRERSRFLDDVKEYWADCRAAVRYYKSHNMTDKLTYRGDITDEEATELLHNRESLKDINLPKQYDEHDPERRVWDFIYSMNRTDEERSEGEHLAMFFLD